jgi:hypothetical protein
MAPGPLPAVNGEGEATSIATIQLRAEIVIEFDAEDYIEAAAHQRRLAQALAELKVEYPRTKLSIKERRDRGAKPSLSRLPVPSGRLKDYG